jgi:hypothetical protein
MNLRSFGPFAIAGALLAALSMAAPGYAQKPQYGPWMPLSDGMQNGVQIAFKLYPDGTQYFKLKNTYKVPVSVSCKFSFETRDGKRQTNSGCNANNLAPGAEAMGMGMFDFGVASDDPSSFTAKVKLLGAPGGGSSDRITSSSSGESTAGPPDDTFVANPSREGGGHSASPDQHYSTGSSGVCKIGERANGLPDGEDLLPGVAWEQRVAHDANLCPSTVMAGTRMDHVAVYEQDTTRFKVIKNGVVTDCTSAVRTHFVRCVHAGEGKNYPKSGFTIKVPTAVIGNTG